MTTLLLRLAGPLQAWGTASRFAYRFTDTQPSKSAIIGLLAAADGRRRTDDIEDLLGLRFGVRRDQVGAVVRDFQTARALDESYSLPLTYRYYLSDAAFVAAVEGADDLIHGLEMALRRPAFPLYLGRRSCPPGQPILIGVREAPFDRVLKSTDSRTGAPWTAADWYRRRQRGLVELDIVRDAIGDEEPTASPADLPISFDPNHRRYALRGIVRETCVVENPRERAERPSSVTVGAITTHDPMDNWGR